MSPGGRGLASGVARWRVWLTAPTGTASDRGEGPRDTGRLRRALLICGLVASPWYVATDLLAGSLWAGYSFTNQAISELSAIGAPTRTLELALGLVYTALMLAFGYGVWRSVRHRALRITGTLILGIGALGLAWTFFPIHLAGSEVTWTDTVHTVLAGVNVALFLAAIGFGAFASGRRFLIYSFGTFLTLLAAGAVSFGLAGSQMARQGILAPLPWFGLIERVDAYLCVLWVAVLATVLLRAEGEASSTGVSRTQRESRVSNR